MHRLLETLEALGYVTHTKADECWHLTAQIKALSAGFHDDLWVTRVAAPIIQELGRELLWPVDLVTFEHDAMIIRETTHFQSPFSIDRGMAGTYLPILGTAGGRAYLAFCPADERKAILDHLRRSKNADAAPAHDSHYIEHLLADTKRLGYGSRYEGFNPHTASISLPVRQGERVLACVTVIWIASAMSFGEGVKRNLAPLQRAATRIEGQVCNLDLAPVS